MAGKTYLETAEACGKIAHEALEVVRNALTAGKLPEYTEGMTDLKKKVGEWNKCLRNVEFEKLLHTDSPMISAVRQFYVDGYKIKEEKDKDTEAIIAVSFEEKQSRIDLEEFCEFGNLDTKWAHSAALLRDLLEVQKTEVYSMKPAELAKKSYYFISKMKAKENGETPDSNTQIVRLLQQVVDEAIFVDNGDGKNVYKCNNHDIAFINDAVTKFNPKEKCSIQTLNSRQFKTVMMSVFAHCLGESITVKTAKAKKNA